MDYKITTFYHFAELNPERVDEVHDLLCQLSEDLHISGLVILGAEGINATVAALPENLKQFKKELTALPEFQDMLFKDSEADKAPFARFKVKIRPEIVSLRSEDYFPGRKNNHLSPAEWNKVLKEDGDFILIDTRNDYEVDVGKFKGAVDPKLKMFNEFPEYVKNSGIPKDKKVLMYCTGGIRCEKAIYEMQAQGYENVYQLEGGILKYLEEFPDDEFEGECFVFDHRVAVNQELKPSTKYHLCPHCGDPGTVHLTCINCGKEAGICDKCEATAYFHTCSKNCAHHAERKALQVL